MPVLRSIAVAAGSAALVAGAGIAGSAPSVALPAPDEVLVSPAQTWVQSFQRPSRDAPCVAPEALDIAWQSTWPAGGREWQTSWEQWPNGGTGGWTCTRSIAWAPATWINTFR